MVEHFLQVLMANGTTKPIQNIERGDMVAGDLHRKTRFKVARLIQTKISANTKVSIVKISKDALGKKQPSQELIISSGHPILYNSLRYRAKCFKNMKGVKYYSKNKTSANKVLPLDDNGQTYSLYNMQFEHDGSFVANDLTIDSVPVNSSIMPLPKSLYFNNNFYNKKSNSKIDIPRLTKKMLIR